MNGYKNDTSKIEKMYKLFFLGYYSCSESSLVVEKG